MLKWLFPALAALLFCAPSASAYSVLTHQANIDSTFDVCLVPLIKSRFGTATRQEWIDAKSYAYGGAIIQDMGFYPFGSKLFTNLTHYVRSGDFVRNLLDEAHDRNEYAFALGALAHYVADIKGHPAGTNVAMASVYPDLKAKFGSAITYHEAPVQHTQLEFAFDVVQLASGRYRSADYQSFIGFQVSKPVLERAFLKTYGLELGQVLANVDLAVGSYRFAVRQLIPIAARAAWHAERDEIRKLSPQARRRDYMYRQSEREYRRQYGTDYQKPGFGARMLSLVVRVLPKIGPLQPFAFKLPTPEAQQLFKKSVRLVMREYCKLAQQEQTAKSPPLPNADFDTGRPTRAGEYALADETYGEWVRKLADKKFDNISAPQRQNILAFFGDMSKLPVDEEEKEAKNLEKTREALKELQNLQAPVVETEKP
ncbi:zinc dependent phospholipase C family protein [Hymenobacter sp. BT188]|uniref:zinc dependent phospholipase C family protein n=1 Tax=Hymenobacter sp. BT188 TaxID=2763504 RepID=UPI0016519E95|nr:zinc dependent phospholipase C family protein [Hymenobacter sp. BT188]MBC6607243.1 zinc dependent phospholipase C family protein [Hymenobacter sp. BT188]